MADVHLLRVYSLDEQKLSARKEFSSDQRDEAFAACAGAETEHRGLDDVKNVLVAADSLDTIRHTHSSYFRKKDDRMTLALEELLERT